MKTLSDFKVHPTAALFPVIEGDDFMELCESIKGCGLIDPIVVDGDELIDGRNRLRACERMNVQPRFTEWQSFETRHTKSSWILSKNVTRRHLTADQRAAIWAKGNKQAASELAARNKEAAQFKPGDDRQNPGGKAVVNLNSGSPQTEPKKSKKRDAKKMHADSTAGKVAAGAGVSRHKAEQALSLTDSPAIDEVIAGTTTLKDAVKKETPKRAKKAKPLKEQVLKDLAKLCSKWGADKKREVIGYILEALQ